MTEETGQQQKKAVQAGPFTLYNDSELEVQGEVAAFYSELNVSPCSEPSRLQRGMDEHHNGRDK